MILKALNPAQQAAVSAPLGHQLVLAGAGSGKTRVLTHRILWLIQTENISPYHILAVTFTNKAAHEMRQRVESLLNISAKQMWIGTFHGICHRLLRAHWQEAGLIASFQILDSSDQLRLIKRIIQSLNLDENHFPPKESQWFINAEKEKGNDPKDVKATDLHHEFLVKIYQAYQENCQRAGVIDFADLLFKSYQLLLRNEALRIHYQERFSALLVDEFQDTNFIQYAWLKLLAGKKSSVMIVGDDDQSIYGWRGARIENIHLFSNDFPNATTIRLEQNYRSTGTILKAANALISQNRDRLGKNLWTAGQEGDPITLYAGFNETDEAFFIVSQIRKLRPTEYALADMAILYRSNAQSRVIEEALMQFGIPYRVYGGLRYFDRAEIKDALAYLRLMSNHNDDASFDRIINTPTRGIGARTISAIREHAKIHELSLWNALLDLLHRQHFSARSSNALQQFISLIETLAEKVKDLPLQKQVESMINDSGLLAFYRKEKGEKGITRAENLEELINAARQFTDEGNGSEELSPLAAFLSYAALESNEDQLQNEEGVQLMTLHSAKGLEFPVVFLSGCEEELFPHYLSIHDPNAIEEERRLCYVGITRAMKKLYLSYAEVRRMHGKESYHRPSRFLKEIPQECLENMQFRTKVNRPAEEKTSDFRIGKEVYHRIFGEGTIIDCEGQGEEMKVKVRFPTVGTKVLIASYLTVKK